MGEQSGVQLILFHSFTSFLAALLSPQETPSSLQTCGHPTLLQMSMHAGNRGQGTLEVSTLTKGEAITRTGFSRDFFFFKFDDYQKYFKQILSSFQLYA